MPENTILLPESCITASALYSLAGKMKALEAFCARHDGDTLPCLTSVVIDGSRVFASVRFGRLAYKLELVGSSWLFC